MQTPQTRVLALVAAYGKAEIEDQLRRWANVAVAQIDADGDVWLDREEEYSSGCWLDSAPLGLAADHISEYLGSA
jgi:hypothetical protein